MIQESCQQVYDEHHLQNTLVYLDFSSRDGEKRTTSYFEFKEASSVKPLDQLPSLTNRVYDAIVDEICDGHMPSIWCRNSSPRASASPANRFSRLLHS